ncbi:MAG TPA: Mur ligase family protein [Patescibacteria group bacterium]|nr:Mur ligase family protein [Patescibacteria group bacterium]
MINAFLILFGKFFSFVSTLLNLGSGSTWPGHIALKINPHFIKNLLQNSQTKLIFIAGTNGKTTTASLVQTALTENGKTVIQNKSGANLLNGIASTLLMNTNSLGKLTTNYAIFEVDENTLPLLLKQTTPESIVLLNLFRDQLDRYGEVNTISANWIKALSLLSEKTTLILNADDPQIAHLATATKAAIIYFGLQQAQFNKTKLQHAADSVYCPHCGSPLVFDALAFSHLGDWRCSTCSFKRPLLEQSSFLIYPLPGLYNKYNVLAAAATLKHQGLSEQQINDAFTDFTPAFGRQEIVKYKNKQLQLFLSKNPTSFNESYRTIQELGGQTLLLVLNDRIPDGRDISWIWDIDVHDLHKFKKIIISGDRVYDMALRIKYDGYTNYETFEDLSDAIHEGVKLINDNETLFILPTYSAMLDVRKIITGKKIL